MGVTDAIWCVFCNQKPCTDINQTFRIFLSKVELEVISFLKISVNKKVCHGNAFSKLGILFVHYI